MIRSRESNARKPVVPYAGLPHLFWRIEKMRIELVALNGNIFEAVEVRESPQELVVFNDRVWTKKKGSVWEEQKCTFVPLPPMLGNRYSGNRGYGVPDQTPPASLQGKA
jgi:hypothetical protein